MIPLFQPRNSPFLDDLCAGENTYMVCFECLSAFPMHSAYGRQCPICGQSVGITNVVGTIGNESSRDKANKLAMDLAMQRKGRSPSIIVTKEGKQ